MHSIDGVKTGPFEIGNQLYEEQDIIMKTVKMQGCCTKFLTIFAKMSPLPLTALLLHLRVLFGREIQSCD